MGLSTVLLCPTALLASSNSYFIFPLGKVTNLTDIPLTLSATRAFRTSSAWQTQPAGFSWEEDSCPSLPHQPRSLPRSAGLTDTPSCLTATTVFYSRFLFHLLHLPAHPPLFLWSSFPFSVDSSTASPVRQETLASSI